MTTEHLDPGVACCVPLGTQQRNNAPNDATSGATGKQQGGLKALALQAMARNSSATAAQQDAVSAVAEARALIQAGATAEGVRHDILLAHLDPEDFEVYGRDQLPDLRRPEFAQAVARAVEAAAARGSCSCDRCKARRRGGP
jgi:hypothetical protein